MMGKRPDLVAEFDDWEDFFFQAEDGIRDYKVTGVQTCALPIWLLGEPRRAAQELAGGPHLGTGLERRAAGRRTGQVEEGHRPDPGLGGEVARGRDRSEERRVGKEGRSRWSPDH